MESVRTEDGSLWLVKRCLNCHERPVEEVIMVCDTKRSCNGYPLTDKEAEQVWESTEPKEEVTVKFLKEMTLENLSDDLDDDEKTISLSAYECCKCHWCFIGDCERTGHGYDLEGTQMPNYCPMCGTKIKEYIE